MRLKGSSSRWVQRQASDPYVKQRQKDGYRSRAAYKLLELQQRDRLIRPGDKVVDLGAAPGSWSEIAAKLVGNSGHVVALDCLEMAPIDRVTVLVGDMRDESTVQALMTALGGEDADVVLSDMAPNLCGDKATDRIRAAELVEHAVQFAQQVLKKQGTLLIKVFPGHDAEQILRALRRQFDSVSVRKPTSSRAESSEVYWVAKGFRRLD